MERLTFVDENGMVLFENPAGFPEDIGFTIRELAENEEWAALDNIAERLANCEQRLKHYESLEEKGLLLKLPCKVGDLVWSIKTNEVILHEIVSIEITKNGVCFVSRYPFCTLEDFGKTVFLTQAEAEEALKRLEVAAK